LVFVAFLVAGLVGGFPSDGLAKGDRGFITEWLVCGPFPGEGGRGFYIDYLAEAGGEEKIEPEEGFFHHSKSVEEGIVRWRKYSAEENGFVDFKKLCTPNEDVVAYAFATIESPEKERAVLSIGGNGGIQVWLNHELIYEDRIYDRPRPGREVVVVELKKGANPCLVKGAERGPKWGFFLRKFDVDGDLFVNEQDIVVPDLRVGERLGAWGYVSVLNTGTDRIDVDVRVKENDLFSASTSRASGLEPGEVRRVPFWLATKREVGPEEKSDIEIQIATDGESHRISLKPIIRKRDEYFVTTYRSEVDGSVQHYSLLVPTSYDEDRAYPLIVLLHGAWVTNWGQNIVSYTLKEWCIQVAPHGRGNTRYTEIGERDLFEVLKQVKRRYNIDEDIYLSGHSMGGYGTWIQGVRHPDRWAAISPQAGYTDFFLRVRKDIPEFSVLLFKEDSPFYFAENLLHLPCFVIHGEKDPVVSVEHDRKMVATLKKLGYDVVYDENPGKGHWWGPRGRWSGVECVDKPPIYEFFQKYRRKLYPKKVVYKTMSLRFNKAYWVTIDELREVYKMARIEAEVVGQNRIDVKLENISQFTLNLNESLVDMDRPVAIYVDGDLRYEGPIPRSGKLTLKARFDAKGNLKGFSQVLDDYLEALLDEKGHVETYLVTEGPRRLRKRPELFGPIVDAFNSKFVIVYGTVGDDPREIEANRKAAYQTALEWRSWANGSCEVKRDVEVTPDDIRTCNLILYGGPKSNELTAEINDKLPIRIEGDAVVMGRRRFAGEDLGLKMIYPNPLNPERYVVINAGVTWKGVEVVHRLGRQLPDYVVFRAESVKQGLKDYLAAGFFDGNWQLSE